MVAHASFIDEVGGYVVLACWLLVHNFQRQCSHLVNVWMVTKLKQAGSSLPNPIHRLFLQCLSLPHASFYPNRVEWALFSDVSSKMCLVTISIVVSRTTICLSIRVLTAKHYRLLPDYKTL